MMQKKETPPYWLGLFGVIPLIGALVGFIVILLGAIKYRSRAMIIIGVADILFTVLIYSGLFYFVFHSKTVEKGFAVMSQSQLDKLPDVIEYYKYKNGRYPDNIGELDSLHMDVFIADPLQMQKLRSDDAYYYYKKIGSKYTVFSKGEDGIAHTKDDFYPKIGWDSTKYGLIKQ